MMTGYKKMALLLALTLTVSCSREVSERDASVMPVSFRSDMDSYRAKATDTSFENNDMVQLWAGGGLEAAALPMVSDGSALVPAEPLLWCELVPLDAVLSAVYPVDPDALYTQDACDSLLTFTVNADQSTHSLYTASDLMLGSAVAEFWQPAVTLSFRHMLDKYLIRITNELDDPVKDVYIDNVYGAVKFRIPDDTGLYGIEGSLGTVRAAAASTSDGTPVWTAILPPQETALSLLVATESGKVFRYSSETFCVSESGVQMTLDLTLSPLSLYSDANPVVSGWTSDKDLNFHAN